MFSILNAIEFKNMIWIIPIILLFHELEEWNIIKWHKAKFKDLPQETNLSVRMWILFLSLMGFIWTEISFLIPSNVISTLLIYVLVDFTLLNALQHLYYLFYFKQYYNPGAFFSIVFGIPADIYITYRILSEGLLPFWILVVLVILIVPGLATTIRSGNRMSKGVHTVNKFGIKLVSWLSN